MNLNGLTSAQVKTRIKQGRVNQPPKKNQTTTKKIIFSSTFTIFNLVNLILAFMIIFVGAYKNLFFLFVAIANTLISIVNGIKAKKTIDKMRLVAEQKPAVVRNGKTIQIKQSEIVEGDLLIYALGDQVLVDSRIEQGTIEVNESFITGEQDNIQKHPGDKLISGSFVVSGTCKATAVAVGKDNFINKLESNAHAIKAANSKLFSLINNIVKYTSFALIPIGALLLWSRFNVDNTTPEIAVTSTVAGLISMIPEGLVLLTSSVLALATVRLGKKQVLVQDLYSIETLARVDTICLDKTGTLTTGKMSVQDLIPAEGQTKNALEDALKLILSSQTTDNATSIALKAKLLKNPKFKPTERIIGIIPFSSDRKYSGVRTKKAVYLMGAPEFILVDQKTIKFMESVANGCRIIAITKNTTQYANDTTADVVPIKDNKLIGFALLRDELRKDSKKIINFFKENDVAIKIISGDNIKTVQSIAKTVGVPDPNPIDLSTIESPNYSQLVKKYNIFTRVKPSQKKSLIKAFQKQGATVAMTGDGVNDILAMKEADCSIAIGEGSDAARRSAKLVLLNSNFAAVPSIIAEGRQSINNLERSATLFLSKNTYAAILAILFIIIPIEYPYNPLEMSLLNVTCIGLPGVILALETNTARIKNKFIKNILHFSVPTGITVAITMLALSILATNIGYTRSELITTSVIVTFTINFLLIFWISKPISFLRSILLTGILGVMFIVFAVPLFRNFFDFVLLPFDKLFIAALLIAASCTTFAIIRHFAHRLSPKVLAKYPFFNL